MANHPQQPGEYDAVLGGQNQAPESGAVLGGIQGVKLRLSNPNPQVRIAGLGQAGNYGEAGLDLVIQSLNDQSPDVQNAAYSLLKSRTEPRARQALRIFDASFRFETVTVDAQGKIINRRQLQAKHFLEDLGNGVTLDMVLIPGETFLMGSPESEASGYSWERPEHPQHQVTVPNFCIGKYQLTQAQYQAIMGINPSQMRGDNRPVERVTWHNAVEFCERLSQRSGRKYRLPSEAEWEYACRAGTTTPFHFGETITSELANYDASYTYGPGVTNTNIFYRQETTSVGSFGVANAFGLYDMHGNVSEWCLDDRHHHYHGAPTDGSAWLGDQRKLSKKERRAVVQRNTNLSQREKNSVLRGNTNPFPKEIRAVMRGGSFISKPVNCRSAYRDLNCRRDVYSDGFGFRVACSVNMII